MNVIYEVGHDGNLVVTVRSYTPRLSNCDAIPGVPVTTPNFCDRLLDRIPTFTGTTRFKRKGHPGPGFELPVRFHASEISPSSQSINRAARLS